MITKLTMHPLGRGLFRATLDDGTEIVARSRQPIFDACRALNARGVGGMVEAWHAGARFPAMTVGVAIGAALAVSETDRDGQLVREIADNNEWAQATDHEGDEVAVGPKDTPAAGMAALPHMGSRFRPSPEGGATPVAGQHGGRG